MKFLTSALYSPEKKGKENLVGIIVTEFDPEAIAVRPVVKYMTKDELVQTPDNELAGFYMQDGILYSDTICRKVFDGNLMSYVENESGYSADSKGLIDVLLFGSENWCSILQNPEECVSDSNAEKRLIACQSFKVSNSSFNIYAPYLLGEGFRTMSLVNIETEEVPEFTLAVPNEALGLVSQLGGLVTPSAVEADDNYVYYNVDCNLKGASTFMGEGFVHYLAFHVAFYGMGLKVVKQFLNETKYVGTTEERKEYRRRVPKRNVAISCTYKEVWTKEILDMLADKEHGVERLHELVEEVPEARITLSWINKIQDDAAKIVGENADDSVYMACMNLMTPLQKALQKYSLELLAQRFYIAEVGVANDPFPNPLKGGGVIGASIKEFTW